MLYYLVSQLSACRRQAHALALAAVIGVAAVSAVGFGSPALAQSEPTINQIYDTARAGKVAEAQAMVEKVLTAHPQSAKAHFVQAELFARQGNAARAREALAQADKLAPGLSFASADAVQALRRQLTAKPAATSGLSDNSGARSSTANPVNSARPEPIPAKSPFPLGLGLALGGAAIGAAIYFARRTKTSSGLVGSASSSAGDNVPANTFQPNAAAPAGSGLSGPQSFGMGTAGARPSYGPVSSANGYGYGYGQATPAGGYPQPGAGAGAAPSVMSGMGGRLAGGLATGLAVGAGVMAAQAIGNSFSHRGDSNSSGATGGEHGNRASGDNSAASNPGSLAADAGQPLSGNSDLGGQNFGMNDSASAGGWDDAGSQDSFSADMGGGGGDWDT